MPIKDDDLLYVQRPSGADAGSYKIEVGDLQDSLTAPSPEKIYYEYPDSGVQRTIQDRLAGLCKC